MNRRAFLSALVAAMTLDPERLLWVPGKKMVSISSHRLRLFRYSGWYTDLEWFSCSTQVFGLATLLDIPALQKNLGDLGVAELDRNGPDGFRYKQLEGFSRIYCQ